MENNGQLSPSQTTRLLRDLNHIPQKKLGQNFLVDSNIVRKSLELADIKAGDNIVEVGPGLGTLTGALLERGTKVWAVEFDTHLYSFVKNNFKNSDFNVINADAVDYPLASLPDEVQDFKIVANLPYAISTPWLEKVLSGKLPSVMSLMLQKEAARRFSAAVDSGDYTPISIMLSLAYRTLVKHNVSSACFHPRPNVDSTLIAFERLEEPFTFSKKSKLLIRNVFSKRRKQLISIAKSAGEDSATLLRWLDESPEISPTARPETVPPNVWRHLDSIVSEGI